ncbi:MAG: DUF2398 family protein [Erysipelotrichia bacterium]|nr:DUF2398 family protein [Erysipelotrichia bacterium]
MDFETGDNEQIEKIGRETFMPILNILTENPFFYASDDPVRFNSLRRHKSAFEKFFKRFFDWRLYVDSKMARLIRDRSFNPSLKSAHKRVFNLTGRVECILFMILLEFYEHECEEQSLSYDDADNIRFAFGSYFDFVRKVFVDRNIEQRLTERELDVEARNLLRKLEQYRLISVVERDGQFAGGADELLIEALPGLNCYESRNLAARVIDKTFGAEDQEFEDTTAENAEQANAASEAEKIR